MYNLLGMNVEWKYLSGKRVEIIGLIGNVLEMCENVLKNI